MSDITQQIATLSPEKLQGLADRLLAKRPVAVQEERIPARAERPAAIPLSYSQEGLWLLDRLGSGASYNETMALRIEGRLDVAALERSFGEIIRRHEILRTRIVTSADGLGQQVIDPPREFRLQVIDLSTPESLDGSDRDEVMIRNVDKLRLPFKLDVEPLVRIALLRLSDTEHVLGFAVHHIIWDMASFSILLRELNILYASFVAGRPSPLPPLEAQYADYAIWQRERLQAAEYEKQLGYWKRQLAGVPPALELPADRPRRTHPSFEGAHVWFTITQNTAAALKQLSGSEGATLHMILLAAFQLLLSRWTGQQDLVVGTPVAGRGRKPADQMIGYFVNLQAIRGDLSGDPTFRQFLGRVRETALDAIANQDIPFDRVVAELQTERDSTRHGLFQVAFAVQSQSVGGAGAGPGPARALSITPMNLRHETSKFDLHMELFETPDGATGKIEYATDLFDAETMERFAVNFANLLNAIVAQPDRRISQLDLLSEADRRQLVVEWNDTATAFPAGRCIQQLFEEQAGRTPEAIAVVCGSGQVTYRELNERSNRLAHDLIRQGVGPDVLVGLFLERSLDVVVAMLGVLKAGGAYLPVDPSYPDDRIRYVLDDARVPVVLTQQQLLERWSSIGAEAAVQCLDTLDLASLPAENPPVTAWSASLAYVIYTSGSTGGPKGVAVTHAAVNRLVRDTNYIEILPTDNIAQVSNNSFDAATFEIWGALLNGARLTVIPKNEALSPVEFAAQLRRSSITTLFVTTALFNQYVRQVPGIFAPLRHVLFGGEAVDPTAVREVLLHGKPAQLLHVYGPTESTTFASFHPVESVSDDATTVPIGRPVSNTTIHVLDGSLEPVPVGVIGELCIGGAGLARGYLGRPALTAEKFVPNPFGESGGRLYRTGDRVRLLPGGAIEFVGRIDDQVKIRGFRIELGEIESILLKHPAVRECAVVAREDDGRRQLVAYVVAPDGADHQALRAHVHESLPDYMVPAAFVTVARLPLSPNGKLDRAALPSPDFREQTDSEYVAPRTAAEVRIAAIMQELLKLDRVGVTDNFFDIGGDSIVAIQVIAHAKDTGLRIRLTDLFQQQTVEKIAAVAKDAQPSRVKEESGEGPVPLTPIQRKVIELMGDNFSLNVPVTVWECSERVSAATLERSLRLLVAQHDALRLGVRKTASGHEQWNAGPGVTDEVTLLTELDLSHVETPEERLAALQESAQRLSAMIDLTAPPILRAGLIDFGADRPQRLLLAIHHLALDPVSLPILMEDLQRFYTAARDGREVVRPAKATSYKKWAEKIAAFAASPAMEAEAEFWRSRPWSRCNPLPRDREDGGEPLPRIAAVSLDENDTETLLKTVQRQYGMQVDELLLAAVADAVAQWTGSRTVLVDLMHHGRVDIFRQVDVSRTVGWFSTEIPLVLDLGAASGIEESVAAVRRELRSMPNHGIGFGVLRYLKGDALLAAAPAPEIRLNHLGRMAGGASDALFRSRFNELPAQAASRLDRLVEVRTILHGNRLQAQWLYDASVHDAATIRRVADLFVNNVRALAAAPVATP